MNKIAEGTAVLQEYAVYELSGVVKSETTRSETSVSGYMPNNNSSMGGRISSQTTTFQTIYFAGDKGKEHAIELIDLTIPCTEGHQLTVWGVNKGAWFAVKNHTTEQTASSKVPLTNFTMPLKTMRYAMYIIDILLFLFFISVLVDEVGIGNIIFSAVGAVFLGGIFYLLLLIPGKIISVIRSTQILSAKNQHAGT
jgi:hypothetical protein